MDAVTVNIAKLEQDVRDLVHLVHKPGHSDWKACALTVAKKLTEEMSQEQLCEIVGVENNPERLLPIRTCLPSMAATIIIEGMIRRAESEEATA